MIDPARFFPNDLVVGQSQNKSTPSSASPKVVRVSVIILNYNGARWIERCLDSLTKQTIFPQIEVIVADNLSTDGSDKIAEVLLHNWTNGHFIQNGENLGFSEGNNRPSLKARGKYLFFLNNDAWLEPDCLDVLLREIESCGATGGNPLVLNYHDNTFQSCGAHGIDPFGLLTPRTFRTGTHEVLMPEGCGYLIEKEWFIRLSGFDRCFFMYAEEFDLSVRVWLSGGRLLAVPQAKMHHRQAANVNPGESQAVEFRTSDRVRYLTNRNCLWVLLINGQHILLGIAVLQAAFLLLEAIIALMLLRNFRLVKLSYLEAIWDCWRMRKKWLSGRQTFSPLRKRGDWFMLRFLSLRFNRFMEVKRMLKMGLPKIAVTGTKPPT
jgi:GT2 family glycosyltransferase